MFGLGPPELIVIGIVVLIFILLCIASSIRPYWSKYWLKEDMEAVATYGTKHNLEKTRKRLAQVLDEGGHDFEVDDFNIHKSENNTVSISISYIDEISIFGLVLKELGFDIKTTMREVKEFF